MWCMERTIVEDSKFEMATQTSMQYMYWWIWQSSCNDVMLHCSSSSYFIFLQMLFGMLLVDLRFRSMLVYLIVIVAILDIAGLLFLWSINLHKMVRFQIQLISIYIVANSSQSLVFYIVILLNSRIGESSKRVLFNLVLYVTCTANSTDVIKPCCSHGVSTRLNTLLFQRIIIMLHLWKIFYTFLD